MAKISKSRRLLPMQKRQLYRTRVRKSRCRKLGVSVCSKRIKCKMANGSQRRYCRKMKNASI